MSERRPFALPGAISVSPSEKYDRSNEAEFRAEVSRLLATMSAQAEARYIRSGTSVTATYLEVTDGLAAPGAGAGKARIYVDTADGDLKVVFADGVVKTLATDT